MMQQIYIISTEHKSPDYLHTPEQERRLLRVSQNWGDLISIIGETVGSINYFADGLEEDIAEILNEEVIILSRLSGAQAQQRASSRIRECAPMKFDYPQLLSMAKSARGGIPVKIFQTALPVTEESVIGQLMRVGLKGDLEKDDSEWYQSVKRSRLKHNLLHAGKLHTCNLFINDPEMEVYRIEVDRWDFQSLQPLLLKERVIYGTLPRATQSRMQTHFLPQGIKLYIRYT